MVNSQRTNVEQLCVMQGQGNKRGFMWGEKANEKYTQSPHEKGIYS